MTARVQLQVSFVGETTFQDGTITHLELRINNLQSRIFVPLNPPTESQLGTLMLDIASTVKHSTKTIDAISIALQKINSLVMYANFEKVIPDPSVLTAMPDGSFQSQTKTITQSVPIKLEGYQFQPNMNYLIQVTNDGLTLIARSLILFC